MQNKFLFPPLALHFLQEKYVWHSTLLFIIHYVQRIQSETTQQIALPNSLSTQSKRLRQNLSSFAPFLV